MCNVYAFIRIYFGIYYASQDTYCRNQTNNTELICVWLVSLPSSFIYLLLPFLFFCFIEYTMEYPGPTLQITLCESPEINMSPIFWYDGAKNVVEHCGKRIKILFGCPFEGWTDRVWPSKPICQKGSALKRTSVQDFNSFFIMSYYINSTTFKKNEDLFCRVIFSDFHTVWGGNS